VVAGVIVVLATHALGLQAPLAAALGVLTAVALNLALTAYSRWAYRR
jgi:predicted outer membrane lipoprotein